MTLWGIYKAIETLTDQGQRDGAFDLAIFGARFMAATLGAEGAMPQQVEQLLVASAIQTIENFHRGLTRRDTVIAFTYSLLRMKAKSHGKEGISREEAAQIASELLPEEGPFTTEQWRKIVDRWAADSRRKLPPVGLRKREKKK